MVPVDSLDRGCSFVEPINSTHAVFQCLRTTLVRCCWCKDGCSTNAQYHQSCPCHMRPQLSLYMSLCPHGDSSALRHKCGPNPFLEASTDDPCVVQPASGTCKEELTITPFQSLMHAGWWTVMTMTTVGFGDVIPRTLWGAVLGYVTMLIGVLAVALPISVLSSTFSAKYAQFQKEGIEVRSAALLGDSGTAASVVASSVCREQEGPVDPHTVRGLGVRR